MASRNPSLDVLRGIAVLLVIVCHYPYFKWMGAGWFGVDLFFVLSGFLISGLLFSELQRTGTICLGHFLLRRGFKIYPPFYVFLLVTVFLWPNLRPHIWIESLFLQNYLIPQIQEWPQHGWSHLWSLAVEEHFYLGLPLLLLALKRSNKLASIPKISGLLLAVCFFDRIVSGIVNPPGCAAMFHTDGRVDALFAGVTLGYLYYYQRKRFQHFSRWWLLPCGLVCLAPAIRAAGQPPLVFAYSTMLLLNIMGFAMLLCWSVNHSFHFEPLEFIGRHSYSIYLWHTVVLTPLLAKPITLLSFTADVLISLAVGAMMAKLIETPFLRLRDSLFPGRTEKSGRFVTSAVSPLEQL
jgi:peptidoglycan/LPS O-acetylase OafA/YrhL